MGRAKRGQGTISAEETSWTSIFRGGARLGGTKQAASAVGMVYRVSRPLTRELRPPCIMPNGVSSWHKGGKGENRNETPGVALPPHRTKQSLFPIPLGVWTRTRPFVQAANDTTPSTNLDKAPE